jgi:hypothetical protein
MFEFGHTRASPSRLHLLSSIIAALLLSGIAFSPAPAQRQRSVPAVFVREIRVDPILASFGVDSAHLRSAVIDALRAANRLARTEARDVPALDIAVTVPRSFTGATPEPNALLSLEVGRNLMEDGTARTLVWQRVSDLRSYPTWRALGDNTLREVLGAVRVYVDSLRPGA